MTWPAWLSIAGARRLLAAGKEAAQGAKDVERLRLENAHQREQLTLHDQLRAKSDALDVVRAENAALRERIAQLEDAQGKASKVRIERNAVWLGDDEQPYCQTCYADEKGTLVPLTLPPRSEGRRPSGTCGKCKNRVYLVRPDDPAPEQPPIAPRQRGSSWVHDWRNRP